LFAMPHATNATKTPEILPPYKIETPSYVPQFSQLEAVEPGSAWLRLPRVIDLNFYDQLGRDPLQVCRIWGIADPAVQIERLKEVLEKYPKEKDRRQLLFKAASRGDEAIVRCLVGTGLRVHPDIESAKEQKTKTGELNAIAEDGSVIDESCAPAHAAAGNGKLGCVKIFVDSGVDVDVRDEFGHTPFLIAAYRGEVQVMEYLLAQGADPRATGDDNDFVKEYWGENAGATALELFAPHGDVGMLEVLIDSGLAVTPLAIKGAATAGCDALKLLLERGEYLAESDVESENKRSQENMKRIALEAAPFAIEYGDLDSMRLLLAYQYPFINNSRGSEFQVPDNLHKKFVYGAFNAIVQNRPDKFEFIYDLGLKQHESMSIDGLPNGQRFNIQHLFDKAAEAGSVRCARLLIERYGADPRRFRKNPAVAPLYCASGNDRAEMVRFLLEDHHVDIHIGNGRFAAGPTALWIAITLKSFQCVSLLLQHGGPLDVVDDEIRTVEAPLTAVLIARSNGRVHFRTETNARTYIQETCNDYTVPNSPYVRVVIEPEDKVWLKNLQLRRPNDELRETGEGARVLDKKEARQVGGKCRLAEYPTYEDRAEELNQDDDLIPRQRQAYTLDHLE
jgi:ankyrin repeat protein